MEDGDYRPFHETYKIISFAMSLGLVYPNPAKQRTKTIYILLLLLFVAPVCLIILLDAYRCWIARDISNLFRHTTIVGPFTGAFLKMFLMNYKEREAKILIDEITNDYALYTTLPKSHKLIVDESIRNNRKYVEKCWAIFVVSVVMVFPLMALVLNVYSVTFKDVPTKYMVHDVNIPGIEPEARFKSPYYEFFFVYMFYCAVLYVINFTGYDGFFGLCISHGCLKMELYCKAMEDALKAKTKEEMHEKVRCVIETQCRLFRYVELIQDVFNIWLGLILIATMIQICTCMYYVTEGLDFDMRYIVFIVGTIVHIYLPCLYSSKLKSTSAETATSLYNCGWETVDQLWIKKTVLFMIARAQLPMQIYAFGLFVFDMELFVSILKTSYSMYTLLRS